MSGGFSCCITFTSDALLSLDQNFMLRLNFHENTTLGSIGP